MLKILHTADLHLGLKYNSYEPTVREKLQKARWDALKKLVRKANEENCNLFSIGGDLFDYKNFTKKEAMKVVGILKDFEGKAVLILPGNHDYCKDIEEAWRFFINA